jgi:hypothetical protein
MEMLVYVIQEIAYKEEKKLLMRNKQNNIRDDASDDEVNEGEDEDEDENEDENEDEFLNPDFMRTDKEKKIQSILLMITRIEPFLIIVLSVLLLIHYKPGMSVM